MSDGRFSILEAVKKAYVFVGAGRGYLLRTGAVPLVLQMATTMALQTYRANASMLEIFLWALPANIAFAWFMFAETRFILLGERVDRLPQEPAYLHDRRHGMQLCVIIFLLCDMAFTAASAGMEWSMNMRDSAASTPAALAALFLMGAMFWSLRFFVVHILAAVGYPIRAFLARVHGIEFSARLLGMGILCAVPVYMLLGILLETAFSGPDDLSTGQLAAVALISVPVAFIVPVLLNAAAAFALKDLLGRPEAQA